MSPVGRYDDFVLRAAWIALCAAVLSILVFWRAYVLLPPLPVSGPVSVTSAPAWPEPVSLDGYDWSVFRQRAGLAAGGAGSLAKRFRLAGTYFPYGAGTEVNRKAVLDDLQDGLHHVVGEKDVVKDVTVVRIFRDRVVLRAGVIEEQLWLSFSKPATEAGVSSGAVEGASPRAEAVGETDKFGGKRIGENRWVFKRQSLLDYYSELMDEPERLVAVFDSLKPLYDENRRITGYHLGVEGEGKFFDAVGLRQGDVVRSVNSMKMTSRHRAEYFIKEFVADRANAFILDIERGDEKMKLMYEVR